MDCSEGLFSPAEEAADSGWAESAAVGARAPPSAGLAQCGAVDPPSLYLQSEASRAPFRV